MSIIEISGLTFAYDGSYDLVFENLSLRLDTDWKLGLIGRNGRGKTTLLRLLAGRYAHAGRISSPVAFDSFPYGTGTEIAQDPNSHKPWIEIAGDLHPDYEYWRLSRELHRLEMSDDQLYQPFCTLSNGEQTKLQLALLFSQSDRFLLIDEPTNHLDAQGRALVMDYLNTKRGFLLVSHDRAFLDGCVDHILSLNRADITLQKGNFTTWFTNKERQDAFERAENERLRRDIRRLDAAAKRASQWSDKTEKEKHATPGKSGTSGLRPDRGFVGHKAAKLMRRAKSIEARRTEAAAQKSTLLHNIEQADSLKLHPLAYRAEKLVELNEIGIQYRVPGAPYENRQVLEQVRLTITRGARIALTGRNGSGKSSLLKLIAGEAIPHTGQIRLGSGLVLSYVPQDTSFLEGSPAGYAEACGVDRSLFYAILRKLDFPREQFEKDMTVFSAGQKKKVLLARSLCEQAHLYLWDEPLNYIDVFSRIQIEQLILEYQPTLLFVEHDRAFLDKIATETISL